MKVRYLGPRQSVSVARFGPHPAGEIKDYPDEIALELVATSKRQLFELVAEEKTPGLRSKRKRSTSHAK